MNVRSPTKRTEIGCGEHENVKIVSTWAVVRTCASTRPSMAPARTANAVTAKTRRAACFIDISFPQGRHFGSDQLDRSHRAQTRARSQMDLASDPDGRAEL